MKRIRLILLCLSAVFAAAGLQGCGNKDKGEGDYSIYYLNKESTRIIPREYEIRADGEDTGAVIKELLKKLSEDSGDAEYLRPVFENVSIEKYTLEEKKLTLYFSSEYNNMDRIEEVLARAAIVRTMMQVDGVECFSFYVGGAPLLDKNGNLVGTMTNESFIENPGEQINSIETAELTLYFANKKGNGLAAVTRKVHYSSNISMEKLVMEHLLEGPRGSGLQPAIPEGTKLISASVLEGVCYVSLDENFWTQNYNIDEPVVIYSIVNSLSELPNINKVQISVKGNTSTVYRDEFPLDQLYERNLDYVTE